MDFILSSNQTSVILKNLEEKAVKDLSYSTGESYPILAKQYRELQPNNSAAVVSGGEIVFNINKANLLRDMQIKSTFTTTTTSLAAGTNIGLTIYERIELRTNNKVIMTMSDAYIWARTQQCDEATQNGIFRRSLPLIATTEVPTAGTGLTLVTYTPVFSSFFEKVENAFDLNFYEQMSLSCRVNTAIRGGFIGAMASVTATLWVWTYRPDEKFYNLLRAKNQNPSRPLTMLTYNTITEFQACTSTTSNTMRLNVNYAVFNTYIMIRTNTAVRAAQIKIDSFSLSLGGTMLLENVPFLVGNWESVKHGASALETTSITATTYDDSKAIALNWGMEPWNRVSNTGAVSFSQINYPTITLNHASITAADHTIYVVHEYWNALSLDATNGSVNISVAN